MKIRQKTTIRDRQNAAIARAPKIVRDRVSHLEAVIARLEKDLAEARGANAPECAPGQIATGFDYHNDAVPIPKYAQALAVFDWHTPNHPRRYAIFGVKTRPDGDRFIEVYAPSGPLVIRPSSSNVVHLRVPEIGEDW